MARPPDRLTDAEIKRRTPVWQALSELFLDTEMQTETFQWVARVAVDAGFSVAETRAILETEVLPVFGYNLLSVAGEWAPFDEAFVCQRVLRGLRRRALGRSIDHLLLTPIRRSIRREDWPRLELAMRVCLGQQATQ